MTCGRNDVTLTSVKAVLTLAWLSTEASMAYMPCVGLTRLSDRHAGIAAAVIAAETLIFARNGFRCQLTRPPGG